jgi:hypothetical protein
MIFPAFETNNQFFPKSPSSIPSFASSSNSPKDLSKPGLYKRKRAFEESVKKDLGPEYRVTNSPAKQATLEAALRWKTRNRITDEARDLTEDEIDKLDDAIKEFFKLIDENYPDLLGRKTKLHILRFHVMPFVRTYKSWGKFSEQSLEHIHHIKNECDRRIPGKTEAAKAKQLKYFTDQHMLIVYFASH